MNLNLKAFLGSNNLLWRNALSKETEKTLTEMVAKCSSLSVLNTLGAYHKISIGSQDMFKEYQITHVVPHHWISKGNYPGIWCALFDQVNAYSYDKPPAMLKISFKAEFLLFDPEHEGHQKMWEAWKSIKKNISKPNPSGER